MERRQFIKISSLGFIASSIPEAVYSAFKSKQYPETAEELVEMIEREFPSKFNTEYWDEYFNVGEIPDIPTFSGKVDYLNPQQGPLYKQPYIEKEYVASEISKFKPHENPEEYWIASEKKVIKNAYKLIKKTTLRLNASSVNWRIKPEVEKLIDFETRDKIYRFYARVVFA